MLGYKYERSKGLDSENKDGIKHDKKKKNMINTKCQTHHNPKKNTVITIASTKQWPN